MYRWVCPKRKTGSTGSENQHTDQVKQFLGERLPAHYAYTQTSMDCWSCTAYLDENEGKMAYMRQFHADKWRVVHERLGVIKSAIDVEIGHLARAQG